MTMSGQQSLNAGPSQIYNAPQNHIIVILQINKEITCHLDACRSKLQNTEVVTEPHFTQHVCVRYQQTKIRTAIKGTPRFINLLF